MSAEELLLQDAAAMADGVRSGAVSATTLVQASLARIAATDGRVNAFTDVVRERALRRAGQVDASLASAHAERTRALPLLGVPFAVKNLFDIAGLATLAGSKIERDSVPARSDAALVRRLEAAGAVLVGALNMDEYAYGFTTENSHVGPVHNPHDLTRIAGGSSGGSGAAVAAGQVPLTLGSDTNGSIRVPASLCGVFGLKPTFGRLPRTGSYPFISSLDHLGPFARSVRDLALAYDAMQGPETAGPHDPGCAQRAVAPRPSSSRTPKVPRFTWKTCASARRISSRLRAIVSSPVRCCRRRGSPERSGSAGSTPNRWRASSRATTSCWPPRHRAQRRRSVRNGSKSTASGCRCAPAWGC